MKSPEDWSEIRIRLEITDDRLDDTAPRHNVAPSTPVPVVIAVGGGRRLQAMRWGLVPTWASDPKIGYSTFNARAETLATKAAFRAAWLARRRCLVVADGFYEWRRADRQPFFVTLEGGEPLTMAGLWEERISRDGEVARSCTVITTEANALMQAIHDRMPAIVGPADRGTWLGDAPPAQAAPLLAPYPAARMTAWPVTRRVGDVRNEDPALTAPIGDPIRVS